MLGPFVLQQPDAIPVYSVLKARYRWLRGKLALLTAHHRAHCRILAQAGCVVGVLVAGGDLVDPLPQESKNRVLDIALIAPIGNQLFKLRRQADTLIKLAQHHQAGIGSDRSTVEIQLQFALESEPRSRMTFCSHRHPSSSAVELASQPLQ